MPGATPTTPCRLVPDVSAQADEFTGAITVYQAAVRRLDHHRRDLLRDPDLGGHAGAGERLADVRLATRPRASGVGFVSPLLYAVASNPARYAASFNDITAGNNDIYGLDNGLVFPATTGYDLASGLGSPRLTGPGGTAGLAYYLCSSARRRAGRSSPASARLPAATAGGERVTITGTGFESGGTPDVATIEVGAAQLPPADFTVAQRDLDHGHPAAGPHAAPAGRPGAAGRRRPADVIVTLTDGESSAPGRRRRLRVRRHERRTPSRASPA